MLFLSSLLGLCVVCALNFLFPKQIPILSCRFCPLILPLPYLLRAIFVMLRKNLKTILQAGETSCLMLTQDGGVAGLVEGCWKMPWLQDAEQCSMQVSWRFLLLLTHPVRQKAACRLRSRSLGHSHVNFCVSWADEALQKLLWSVLHYEKTPQLGFVAVNSQSVIRCGTFSCEWHFCFHGQNSQHFFSFPEGLVFLVSFILHSQPTITYISTAEKSCTCFTMSGLPLINLLSKNTLSEAEEMVCSHRVSQILFVHASLFWEASPNACSQGCYGKGHKKVFVFRLALSSLWDGCWWQMSVHHLSTSVCHCLQTSSPQGCVRFVVWSGTALPLTGLDLGSWAGLTAAHPLLQPLGELDFSPSLCPQAGVRNPSNALVFKTWFTQLPVCLHSCSWC